MARRTGAADLARLPVRDAAAVRPAGPGVADRGEDAARVLRDPRPPLRVPRADDADELAGGRDPVVPQPAEPRRLTPGGSRVGRAAQLPDGPPRTAGGPHRRRFRSPRG